MQACGARSGWVQCALADCIAFVLLRAVCLLYQYPERLRERARKVLTVQ
ncbi:hypothetical protein HMPREF3214_00814 [Alloscardovia omnicolens]|nr:hypothetical protein HMPREF3214_00814 [Alloscardovia omnicolens]